MNALIAPVFVQIALTFVVLMAMGSSRVRAARSREIRAALASGQSTSYGRTADLLSDNLKNQFEVPVLFYAAIGLTIASESVTPFLIVLAWVYVILRVAHAIVHVTINHIRTRFLVFLISSLVLMLYWIVFGIELFRS
ncbi:MAG: MAPEG family protein [Pseudomonadota bacterium]